MILHMWKHLMVSMTAELAWFTNPINSTSLARIIVICFIWSFIKIKCHTRHWFVALKENWVTFKRYQTTSCDVKLGQWCTNVIDFKMLRQRVIAASNVFFYIYPALCYPVIVLCILVKWAGQNIPQCLIVPVSNFVTSFYKVFVYKFADLTQIFVWFHMNIFNL
jgi:hypothetical protein